MWTARSGQMVANVLATDVKKMLKSLVLARLQSRVLRLCYFKNQG